MRQPPIEAWRASRKRGSIVWSCTSFCGGNGDRIRGLSSSLSISVCMGANFGIHWTHPYDHGRLFDYPSLPSSPVSTTVYAIDRRITFDPRWNEIMLRNGTIRFFSNSKFGDCDDTRRALFDLYLRPRPAITDLFGRIPTGCRVCLHVRMGDRDMGVGDVREKDPERLLHIAKEYNSANASSRICTFTDSASLKKRLKEDPAYWLSPFHPVHTDRSHKPAFVDVAASWAEIFAMATCSYLVKSGSGFSLVSARLANMTLIKDNVYARTNSSPDSEELKNRSRQPKRSSDVPLSGFSGLLAGIL